MISCVNINKETKIYSAIAAGVSLIILIGLCVYQSITINQLNDKVDKLSSSLDSVVYNQQSASSDISNISSKINGVGDDISTLMSDVARINH